MADMRGEPDLVTFRELAQRLVADKIVEHITHQRISQLRLSDPDFPPVTKIGRAQVVDYRLAKPYFKTRKSRQGQRPKRTEEKP